jgi:GWxTD domain-containing protein
LVLFAGSAWTPLRGAAKGPPGTLDELESWSRGPVRWLLLPAELRELRKIDQPAAATNFVARFWARRDPEPAESGNSFRDTFYRRVENADLLYGEGGTRGALTDRGRALILLGAPGSLRVASEQALQWSPRGDRRTKVVVRELPLEEWIYHLRDLPPVLGGALADLGKGDQIHLSFVVERERTRLGKGEEFLELAARVALARPSAP